MSSHKPSPGRSSIMKIRPSIYQSLILHVLAALAALTCPAFGGEIHDAAKSGDVEKVKTLLKGNPDLVFSKDSNGAVPLHWAALNDRKDVAELLLANNAIVDARESNGQTPLHLAVFNHHNDVMELLLANKADVNARSNNGTTALSLAANKGYRDLVAVLLANKADANAGVPLIAAAQQAALSQTAANKENYKDLVELLLTNKADVNAKDGDGYTALHFAVLGSDNDVVEMLLAHGADVNAKNNNGKTPLDLAQIGGNGMPELLRQRGGSAPASVRVAQATVATGPKPAPAPASSSPVRGAPPTANGVFGKTYVNSDGDTITFRAQGKATETNGVRGTMYPFQSAVFGSGGFAFSDCTYIQNGAKINLTCEAAQEMTVIYTVNKDGSLTGPPEGIYGHAAFAHLTEKKTN
jgi:hypothetical protein